VSEKRGDLRKPTPDDDDDPIDDSDSDASEMEYARDQESREDDVPLPFGEDEGISEK
jgi:hypothetical protein